MAMAGTSTSLQEKLDAAFGGWVSFAAVGAFALHAMGFLSLRFYLAALGVRADLALLDSRYIFEGVNCLVYLLAALCNLLLVGAAAALVLYLVSRLFPQPMRERWNQLRHRPGPPGRLTAVGIVFAVLAIQLVMRHCFYVQDLLFRGVPTGWTGALVRAPADGARTAFFMGLLAAVGVTALLRLAAGHGSTHGRWYRCGLWLLTLLLGMEVALLPINYGVFTAGRPLPRVVHIGDDRAIAGRQAWLVWEDQSGVTLLVVSSAAKGAPPPRTLVTVPKKEAGRVEIGAAEEILRRLSGGGS
jgi:hypothetical protein